MSLTAQMNIRIPQEQKAAGDEALLRIGLTPTEAVRALWELASHQGKDLERIRDLLVPTKQDASPKSEALHSGWMIVDQLLDTPQASITPHSQTDEELLEAALLERYAERGLL